MTTETFIAPQIWTPPVGAGAPRQRNLDVNINPLDCFNILEAAFSEYNRHYVYNDDMTGTAITMDPVVYRAEGGTTLTYVGSNKGYALQPADLSSLAIYAQQCGVRMFRTNAQGVQVDADLKRDRLQIFFDNASHQALPMLNGTVSAPLVKPDGTVRWEAGYDADMAVYVLPGATNMGIDSDWREWCDKLRGMTPEEAHAESKGQAEAAAARLLEFFSVFRFTAPTGGVDALGLALTPWMAKIFGAPIPLGLLMASSPGSGKTTLANTIYDMGGLQQGLHWTLAVMERGGEYELSNRLDAAALAGHRGLLLDNIKSTMESASLEALLTSRIAAVRRFHTQKANIMPWDGLILATLNGPKISADMARRVFPIRLEHADDVRSADLSAMQRRLKQGLQDFSIQRDIVLMVQHWISVGRPEASTAGVGDFGDGTYGEWFHMIGGVLEACGLTGFGVARIEALGNVDIGGGDVAAELEHLVDMFADAHMGGAPWAQYEDGATPGSESGRTVTWRAVDMWNWGMDPMSGSGGSGGLDNPMYTQIRSTYRSVPFFARVLSDANDDQWTEGTRRVPGGEVIDMLYRLSRSRKRKGQWILEWKRP